MELFDLPQARYFCRRYHACNSGTQQSLVDFYSGLPPHVVRLREGSIYFDVYRMSLLNSVERWILYAVSNYRRALDMLVPAAVPWAHVTLYYSSFFAANAVLGMFGGWIGVGRVVEVGEGRPGGQAVRIHRRMRSPRVAGGSHQRFWDFFYDSVAGLTAWTPREFGDALSPSTGNYDWQIVGRNAVNYDMTRAWMSSVDFGGKFDGKHLGTVKGPIALQLEAAEQVIGLAQYFADELAVFSFGFGANENGTRRQIQRRLATRRPPGVVGQSGFAEMIRT